MDLNVELTDNEELMNELECENKVDFDNGESYIEKNIYNLDPEEKIEEE